MPNTQDYYLLMRKIIFGGLLLFSASLFQMHAECTMCCKIWVCSRQEFLWCGYGLESGVGNSYQIILWAVCCLSFSVPMWNYNIAYTSTLMLIHFQHPHYFCLVGCGGHKGVERATPLSFPPLDSFGSSSNCTCCLLKPVGFLLWVKVCHTGAFIWQVGK